MEPIDLFAMREHYNRQQILLCFNGPISKIKPENKINKLPKNKLKNKNKPIGKTPTKNKR